MMMSKGIQCRLAIFTILLFGGLHANAFGFSTGDVTHVTLFNGTGRCPRATAFTTPR